MATVPMLVARELVHSLTVVSLLGLLNAFSLVVD
jgi:hypothetical protein